MGKARDIAVRSASGAVLVAVLIGSLFLSARLFAAVLAAVSCGVLTEFLRLSDLGTCRFSRAAATAACLWTVLAPAFGIAGGPYAAVIIALCIAVPSAELATASSRPLERICVALGGIAYSAAPMTLLWRLTQSPDGYLPVAALAVMVLTWSNDVFAYLVGITFGRHRMFERISPKKSWEGFWGGVICTAAASLLIGSLTGLNGTACLLLGLAVSVAAVVGDLIESMLKRAAGVKDSGKAIPGHGGFMDRFDALILSAPATYAFCQILNPFI